MSELETPASEAQAVPGPGAMLRMEGRYGRSEEDVQKVTGLKLS